MKNIQHGSDANFPGRQKGVTLLELLIVVAIVAIISAIAYPSYTQFIVRTKRAAATAVLMQVADRQQQFFMDNKQFANQLSSLGYPADTFMVNDDGTVVSSGDSRRTYSISMTGATATAFTVDGTPQLGQYANDTDCGTLTLTNTGVKGQSGPGDKCW